MKKRRLAALLTAALIGTSCVPLGTAVTVSADTSNVNSNLIASAEIEGAELISTKAADNTAAVNKNDYLHVYNRRYNNNSDGLIVYFDLSAEQLESGVYVEFDMRHSQASSDGSTATTRPNYNGKGNIDAHSHTPKNDGTWTHVKLTPLSLAEGRNYIRFIKKTSTNQTHPIDFDNFVVYTEDGDYIIDTRNKSFESFVVDGTFVAFGQAKISADTETAYYSADGSADANTEVTYELDAPLAPGYYSLGAEIRIGEFTCIGNKVNGAYDGTYAAGVNDTEVTLTVGGSAEDTYDVTTEWQRFNTLFYVSESADVIKLSENSGEPLDIRNITLTYEGEYIASTEIDDNLIDSSAVFGGNAIEEVTAVNAVAAADGASSYMTIEERNYGQFIVAKLMLDEKPVAGRTYYVSCWGRNSVHSMRASDLANYNFVLRFSANVDIAEAVYGSDNFLLATKYSELCSNRNGVISCEATGTSHDGCQLVLANDWTYTEAQFTPIASSSNNIVLTIKRGPNSLYHHGFDMDSFKVWYVEDGEPIVIYSNNFDEEGSASDFVTPATTFVSKNIIETDYSRITAEGDSNTEISVTFENELEAGYYLFEGSFRLADFYAGNGADNSAVVTVSAGDPENRSTFEIGTTWDDFSIPVYVSEASDTLTVTADCARPIDFDNMSFSLEQPVYQTITAEDNLLDGAVKSASGFQTEVSPVGTDNTATSANRFMTVGGRAWGGTDFVTIEIDEKPVVGRTYYLSMKTRESTECTSAMYLRLRGNVSNAESVYGRSNTNYLLATENDEACKNRAEVISCEADGTVHDGCSFLIDENWKYVEAQFTPDEESNNNLRFIVNRGTNSAYRQPIDIDDFEVWYMDNGEKVSLFASDFESAVPIGRDSSGKTLERFQSTKATLSAVVDTDYTVIGATAGTDTSLSFDVTSVDFETGVYALSCEFRVDGYSTAQDAVNEQSIRAYYTLTDGTVKTTENFTVGSTWSTVSCIVNLAEGEELAEITFVLDGDTALAYRDPVLKFYTSLDKGDGIPNFGIIMMLLAKKAGDNKTVTRTVEFIENGNFNEEPIIFNSAPAAVQSVESAGWYAKNKDTVGTTLSYVTEDGNSFIRVTDLDTSQRGVFWNTGVVLQPGTYTLTMDMRVSETEASEAYNAKKWRDPKKQTMSVRANLGDPNGSFSPHYAAFSPIDLDSPMNAQGQVYGNTMTVTREWTTYTDTIVIDRELLIVFKVGGGTGGEVDAHGFDIDNISIKGKIKYNSEGEVVVDTPKKADNNLIANGGFDEEPTIVDGDAYDAGKSNAWFRNNGMGYKKDNTGKDITTEPKINIDHKIEWTDGYLTFSGRTNNLRQFWFNSGVKLQPGSYKFSIDLKTAKAGETTSIRIGIPGLFTPTVDDSIKLNDTWQTYTLGLNVTAATDVRLNIWGGPGASYIHDFCIDNVVIEKLS